MRQLLAIPFPLCLWLPAALSNPDAALLLLFSGILCIYAEFLLPGSILPGVAGATMALVALADLSHYQLDWRGVALIVAAFTAFAAEAQYSTRGIATLAGAFALLAGALNLFAGPERRIHTITALVIAIPFSLITSFLFSAALRARRNKGLDILKRNLTHARRAEKNDAGG